MLRRLAPILLASLLAMLLFTLHHADDVVRAFVDKSCEVGIDVFRVFDALNDVRNVKQAIAAVRRSTGTSVPATCSRSGSRTASRWWSCRCATPAKA